MTLSHRIGDLRVKRYVFLMSRSFTIRGGASGGRGFKVRKIWAARANTNTDLGRCLFTV
jgi:hypothetical protein